MFFKKILDLNSIDFLLEFCSSATIFDNHPKVFCPSASILDKKQRITLLVNNYFILKYSVMPFWS